MTATGKYARIIPNLQPLPPEDPSFQAKIEEVKKTVTDRDAYSLAESYAIFRKGSGPELTKDEITKLLVRLGKDGIQALASRCEVYVRAYEQLLDDSQSQQADGWGKYGVKDNALRLPGGETIRIEKEPSGKVVDKEAFRLWCIENGYERQLQLHYQTMNTIIKERLLAGEAEPDGTEAYAYTKVKYVKASQAVEE